MAKRERRTRERRNDGERWEEKGGTGCSGERGGRREEEGKYIDVHTRVRSPCMCTYKDEELGIQRRRAYRWSEIPNRGGWERAREDDGGGGQGTTGINNNYWFEPLSVRDLSNLKITSEINYVRLISPGLRSVYRRAYNTRTDTSPFLSAKRVRDAIRAPSSSFFPISPRSIFPRRLFLSTYEHPHRRYYARNRCSRRLRRLSASHPSRRNDSMYPEPRLSGRRSSFYSTK